MNEANDVAVTVQSVHVHPVKSCAGLAPAEALLVETGFDLDRAWMVTDGDFKFVTQRELPRMALVQPTLKGDEMILRAPGMLALHVALERVEARCQARVWEDRVEAYDMGSLCAHWFSDFLGRPLRLVRFDPEQKRLADHRWTGPIDAETALQDGYPLLVASTASLAEVNRRLVVAGEEPVTMARFRPNIVLDGLEAHGEDHLDEIVFDTADGPVRLKLVKPCSRCPMPDVDPATGIGGHAVGDVLQQYRADARLGGALTFGMNAVIVEGFGCSLGVGLSGRAGYRFD
ncbi:MAG: MOSC N-terminal beta barrel domain-containing protein [Pseudomonadota bacterium]|nr:MOSC N-terminal beta barrel domain-containing protein [Pseudomonadota bacterium]